MTEIIVRPARTADVKGIRDLLEPMVEQRVLLGKELVALYESVQEFMIAEVDGELIGCGALHVMWKSLGEIRTLMVHADWARRGIGGLLVESLEVKARDLGLKRLFCLTFEVQFFTRHGFEPIGEKQVVSDEVYAQLLRSPDAGVAEFLELAQIGRAHV